MVRKRRQVQLPRPLIIQDDRITLLGEGTEVYKHCTNVDDREVPRDESISDLRRLRGIRPIRGLSKFSNWLKVSPVTGCTVRSFYSLCSTCCVFLDLFAWRPSNGMDSTPGLLG